MYAWLQRLLKRDDQIDALIAANHFRPREGMTDVDWGKLNRAGERTWNAKLRGQRRYQTAGKADQVQVRKSRGAYE